MRSNGSVFRVDEAVQGEVSLTMQETGDTI